VKRSGQSRRRGVLPIRNIAELLRTKQVTSLELTEMYLARLHRYNGSSQRRHVLDDYGRAEAKRADAEIAAGKYKARWHAIPWGRRTSSRSKASRRRGDRRRSRNSRSTTMRP